MRRRLFLFEEHMAFAHPPMLPVEIAGAIVKRPSVPAVVLVDRLGNPAAVRMRPQLLPNERMIERAGRIPIVLQGAT